MKYLIIVSTWWSNMSLGPPPSVNTSLHRRCHLLVPMSNTCSSLSSISNWLLLLVSKYLQEFVQFSTGSLPFFMFHPFLEGYYQICPFLECNYQFYTQYTKLCLLLRKRKIDFWTFNLLNIKNRKISGLFNLNLQLNINL